MSAFFEDLTDADGLVRESDGEGVGRTVARRRLGRHHAVVSASRLRAVLRDGGLHAALAFLNARARFRFTGVYRVEPPRLLNIQLFDRENPKLSIAGDVSTLADTYCAIVCTTAALFATPNAASDSRLRDHAARDRVISYAGVPLRMPGGHVSGTLCHFDLRPRLVPPAELPVLEAAAPVLAAWIFGHEQSDRQPA